MNYNEDDIFNRVISFLYQVWWGDSIKTVEYKGRTKRQYKLPTKLMVMGEDKEVPDDKDFMAINSIHLAINASAIIGVRESLIFKDLWDVDAHIAFCVFPEEAKYWPDFEETQQECRETGAEIIHFNNEKVWAVSDFSEAVWGEFDEVKYYPDWEFYRELVNSK